MGFETFSKASLFINHFVIINLSLWDLKLIIIIMYLLLVLIINLSLWDLKLDDIKIFDKYKEDY